MFIINMLFLIFYKNFPKLSIYLLRHYYYIFIINPSIFLSLLVSELIGMREDMLSEWTWCKMNLVLMKSILKLLNTNKLFDILSRILFCMYHKKFSLMLLEVKKCFQNQHEQI